MSVSRSKRACSAEVCFFCNSGYVVFFKKKTGYVGRVCFSNGIIWVTGTNKSKPVLPPSHNIVTGYSDLLYYEMSYPVLDCYIM